MPAPLVGFFLLFVAGALLRAGGLLHRTHAERLATIVFSVSLPATILVSLDRITLSPSFWRLPLAAWFVVLPMLLGAWLIGRRLDLTKAAQGSFILATTIMNMAFFAYPLILATMGEQGFVRALLFDLGHGLLVFTVVYGVAVRHGERTAGGRSAFVRFLSAPTLWAVFTVLGLKLAGASLPTLIHQVLTPLHLTTTPLASLVLGLSIDLAALRRNLALASLAVLLRMIGGFLLGLAAVSLLNLTGLERTVVLLSSAMPAGLNSVLFATEERLDPDLAAAIVVLSICLGMGLLPFLPQFSSYLMS